MYPNLEDIQELLQYPTLTLETVRYQSSGIYDNKLQGIQLEFREGLKTPLFQTGYAITTNTKLRSITIDTEDKIT